MITIHIECRDTFLAEAFWIDKAEKYLWFKASFNPKDKYSIDHQRHLSTCRIPYVSEVRVSPVSGILYVTVVVDEERL